jgi:hypothetical protein
MTDNKQAPKEKAKELIDKFVLLDNDIFCSVNYPYSKQCALIAVDEILSINSVDKDVELSDYWEEVKQEIENL